MTHRTRMLVAVAVLITSVACALLGGGSDEGAGAPDAAVPVEATPTEASEAEDEVPEAEAASVVEMATRTEDGMEMSLVPAGAFTMGADESAFAPERPAHLVTLDAYWIDVYEVSNAQYLLCMEADVCVEPKIWWNKELSGDDQPALVPHASAEAYCQWVGGRLPTEAEWEKAVRGTDGRTWPWGNEFVDMIANLSSDLDGYGATSPVGAFPGDLSPYGLLDAAGNAAEWVADWYDADYYQRSPVENPTGPGSGDKRVQRAPIANGGGGPEKCRTTARYAADPNWDFGFRCVRTSEP